MGKRKLIGAKLRPELDGDIEEALDRLLTEGKTDVSQLVRTGLRIVLGLPTERVLEVKERQIKPPMEFLKNIRKDGQ